MLAKWISERRSSHSHRATYKKPEVPGFKSEPRHSLSGPHRPGRAPGASAFLCAMGVAFATPGNTAPGPGPGTRDGRTSPEVPFRFGLHRPRRPWSGDSQRPSAGGHAVGGGGGHPSTTWGGGIPEPPLVWRRDPGRRVPFRPPFVVSWLPGAFPPAWPRQNPQTSPSCDPGRLPARLLTQCLPPTQNVWDAPPARQTRGQAVIITPLPLLPLPHPLNCVVL